MVGYWNGEEAEIKGVTYEVTEAEGKMWWQNQFIGQRRQGIEITYQKKKWIIDNEYGDGFYKVIYGMGSPRVGHKSISNPIKIKHIKDNDINQIVDAVGLKEEQEENRKWAKEVDPEGFKKSEALRNALKNF